MNASSSLLRITRGGQTLDGPVDGDFVTFDVAHDTYSVVATARDSEEDEGSHAVVIQVGHFIHFKSISEPYIIYSQDHGLLDKIPKVLFGGPLSHWVNLLLFLDALSWVSKGKISLPLTR